MVKTQIPALDSKKQLEELRDQVDLGFKKTYLKLIEFKKSKNSPLVVIRDGKVIHIPADEIKIPD